MMKFKDTEDWVLVGMIFHIKIDGTELILMRRRDFDVFSRVYFRSNDWRMSCYCFTLHSYSGKGEWKGIGGRADFEERREARKERYEELSKKSEEKSEKYMNSKANRILEMTPRTAYINWSSFRKNGKEITSKGLGWYWKIYRGG